MSADSTVAALEVQGVSHAYGARVALRDVSLTVPQARFTALLGLNGAGKTTLFSLITRLFHTRQGSYPRARPCGGQRTGEALRRLGVVFQARTLDLDLSVRENLLYHAALHGIGGREARLAADAALQEVGARRAGARTGAAPVGRADAAGGDCPRADAPAAPAGARRADGGSGRRLPRGDPAACARAGGGARRGGAVGDASAGRGGPGDSVVVLHKGRVLAAGETGRVVAETGAADLPGAFARLTGGTADPDEPA